MVDKEEPLTRVTILTLHALVMDKILETKGSFRRSPIYIRGSTMTPPAASQVEPLMREWVVWVHGEGLSYEPVTRAAIAHHGFEAVHPFEDGNGRVGRLLLNLMLMREGYPPALLRRSSSTGRRPRRARRNGADLRLARSNRPRREAWRRCVPHSSRVGNVQLWPHRVLLPNLI
jgi:Fic family protein